MKVYTLYRVKSAGYDSILLESIGTYLDKLSAISAANNDSNLQWKYMSGEGAWVGYTFTYEVVAVIKEQDLLPSSKYPQYVPGKTVIRECPK